jgi:hypothetical protein
MAFTATNTVASGNIVIAGFTVYFRAWASATTKATGAWIDLGYVLNPSRSDEQIVKEIRSARTGKSLVVKSVTTGRTLTIGFDTNSLDDNSVLGLHAGGTVTAGTNADVVVDDVNAQKGELLIVALNAETGGVAFMEYHPAVDLKGNGKTFGDGENEAALSFEATVLSDDAYTIPATIDAGTTSAPYGWFALVASDKISTVKDAIAG